MNPNHTPGPWFTNGYSSPMTGAITVYNKPFGLGDVAEVHDINDARLISAAPDLLEALRNFCEFPQPLTDSERIAIARAAIAKATGEAS